MKVTHLNEFFHSLEIQLHYTVLQFENMQTFEDHCRGYTVYLDLPVPRSSVFSFTNTPRLFLYPVFSCTVLHSDTPATCSSDAQYGFG